ncbi:MAG: lipid biosynthesis B12-binding/radical SAM protein [Pseudomonadota bacterium]
MSKILLISSNTNIEPLPVYPIGMAIIASALKQKGHDVKQFDFLYNQETCGISIENIITRFDPDFIGISIRNIDNVDSLTKNSNWYLADVKQIIHTIKKISKKPVIVGGAAFSIMPEQILNYIKADYGIIGEGEIALPDLIDDLLQNKKIDRIIQAKNNQINNNDFLAPLYENELVKYYVDKTGMLNYQTKRGCPHGCNYCSYPLIEGKKFRKQTPQFVVKNLLAMKKQFNVDSVFFTDSVFNDSQGHYLEVAREMVRQKCDMKWSAYFRPDKISDNELELLKQSGLYAMEIGSDAACDTTLKGINKSFDFDTILALNEGCLKQDIVCAHFFMFGGPGETYETVKESFNNIEKLKGCVVFAFSGIRILPGTQLQNIAIEQNIISKENTLLKPCYYISPHVEKEKMEAWIMAAFKKHKAWLFPPIEGQMRMKALQAFGFKGILWDMLIKFSKMSRRKRKGRVA